MSETWSQLGSEIAGGSNDYFGYSVDMSNDGKTIVVGSIEKSTSSKSEYVRVYIWNGTSWINRGTYTHSGGSTTGYLRGRRKNNNEQYGYSVAISGDGSTVVVGAPYDDGGSSSAGLNKGHIYIYTWNGNSWTQQHTINGIPNYDNFGWDVAISRNANRIIVGAWLHNGGAGNDTGQVMIYDWDGTTARNAREIEGINANDTLGYSLAISANGNRIVVGAPQMRGTANRGYVQVYDYSNSNWTQKGTTIGPSNNDLFGYSVDISDDGNIFIVGAIEESNTSSSEYARVYVWDGSSWANRGKYNGKWWLQGRRANANEQYGYAVAISGDGNRVLIGAPGDDGGSTNTSLNYGRVQLVTWNENSNIWEQTTTFDGEGLYDDFGSALSMNEGGTAFIAGASKNNSNGTDSGHVRIYALEGCMNQDYEEYNASIIKQGTGSCVTLNEVPGCTDASASNYNPSATTDDGSCEAVVTGCTDVSAYNYNSNANTDDGSCEAVVTGCTDASAYNYNSNANTDDGSCEAVVTGCTDTSAYNYNSNANTDDGSCEAVVTGCTDTSAYNYNSNANTDDGSCEAVVTGCTDASAYNYNSNANTDDGSCEAVVTGCTDQLASNYNPNANTDDGSCTFVEVVETQTNRKTINSTLRISNINGALSKMIRIGYNNRNSNTNRSNQPFKINDILRFNNGFITEQNGEIIKSQLLIKVVDSNTIATSNEPICLISDRNVNVIQDPNNENAKLYSFNNRIVYHNKFGLGKGRYLLRNIPSAHPMAILCDSTGLIYDRAVGNANSTVYTKSLKINGIIKSYNFYSGDIDITITSDFGTASVYCFHHGYMGGEDIFMYKNDCIAEEIQQQDSNLIITASSSTRYGDKLNIYGLIKNGKKHHILSTNTHSSSLSTSIKNLHLMSDFKYFLFEIEASTTNPLKLHRLISFEKLKETSRLEITQYTTLVASRIYFNTANYNYTYFSLNILDEIESQINDILDDVNTDRNKIDFIITYLSSLQGIHVHENRNLVDVILSKGFNPDALWNELNSLVYDRDQLENARILLHEEFNETLFKNALYILDAKTCVDHEGNVVETLDEGIHKYGHYPLYLTKTMAIKNSNKGKASSFTFENITYYKPDNPITDVVYTPKTFTPKSNNSILSLKGTTAQYQVVPNDYVGASSSTSSGGSSTSSGGSSTSSGGSSTSSGGSSTSSGGSSTSSGSSGYY